MKKILFLALAIITSCLYGQTLSPLIQRARIFTDEKGLRILDSIGVPLDEGYLKIDEYFESDFYATELEKVRSLGFTIEILVNDLGKYYAERNAASLKKVNHPKYKKQLTKAGSSWPIPNGFSLGSMGGYCTWEEMKAHLDNMVALYPNLITVKAPVSLLFTVEGRPIYWVKISDNPTVNENEPQILYTGVHHAREPLGMQQMLYFMYYLLENYNANPLVQQIVNHTELYFIPVVNPDGYVYNQQTNPDGGGNWRKNRKDGYGVDINRNYGYMWGGTGSSPFINDETYHGPTPFSEFETQNIRDFCNAHQFSIALNYHSFGCQLLYPWGYTDQQNTPDDTLFGMYSKELIRENHYQFGPTSTTLYLASGVSDDWMYGEQGTKPKIYAFTPEVSPEFWVPPELIIQHCQANMWQNMAAAMLVNNYAVVYDQNKPFIPTQGYLKYKIRNLGMLPDTFTVSIQPLSNAFQSLGPPVTYTNLNFLEGRLDSIPYQINTFAFTWQARFLLTVSFNGLCFSDTITKTIGTPWAILQDDCSTLSNWTGSWAVTIADFHSPFACLTDSPLGPYNSDIPNYLQLNHSIDLTTASAATLNFWAKWDIAPDNDYVMVMVSKNGITEWNPIQGLYTHPGDIGQPTGQPLYDGQQYQWVKEEMDLHDFLGYQIYIRFQLFTYLSGFADGYYFDDLEILTVDPAGIKENSELKLLYSDPVPNPANDHVSFSLPKQIDNQSITIEFRNSLGQVVRQERFENYKTEIYTGNWEAGLYFYSVKKGNENLKQGKLLISH